MKPVLIAVVVSVLAACGGSPPAEPDALPPTPEVQDILLAPATTLRPGETLRIDVVLASTETVGSGVLRRGDQTLAVFAQIAPLTFRVEVDWETLVSDDLVGTAGAPVPAGVELVFADVMGQVVTVPLPVPLGCDRLDALCGTSCRDLATDAGHCGACGVDLEAIQTPDFGPRRGSTTCADGVPTAVARNYGAAPDRCDAVCAMLTADGEPLRCDASCSPDEGFLANALLAGGGYTAGLTTYRSDVRSQIEPSWSCDDLPVASVMTEQGTYAYGSQDCCCIMAP